MPDLLTAAQMRSLEQAAIGSGAVSGLELMERAGQGVVDAVFARWPALSATAHAAVVLCGPGNNGGDGFVVARLLRDRGWTVRVYLLGTPEKLPPDARANHDRWAATDPVMPFPACCPDPAQAALVVDAGFGTGLARPLDDKLVAAFLGAVPERDRDAPGRRRTWSRWTFPPACRRTRAH